MDKTWASSKDSVEGNVILEFECWGKLSPPFWLFKPSVVFELCFINGDAGVQ